MQQQAPSPQLQENISRLEKEIELLSQEKLCYESQIIKGGGFKLPPPTCPMKFACLPEFFVEDTLELLMLVSRSNPRALNGVILGDFMNFHYVHGKSRIHQKSIHKSKNG